jgi:predicted enzyme related to lactoylglutathione lyase
MRKPFAHGVGGVLSADIAVPNHQQELEFYSKILTTGDAPLWRADLMNNQGTPIIGLGTRSPEYQNLPLQWMPHFQVADITTSVASAIDLGGQELMRDDQNQWAVLADPAGAAFGIIPVVAAEPNSAETSDRIGCIAWLTLVVSDPASSRSFYQQVIGWNSNASTADNAIDPSVNFEMQLADGTIAAEICHNANEYQGLPAVWLISLPVGDVPKSLRRARENGGEVVWSNTQSSKAILRDPVGVYFALQAELQGLPN